MKDYLDHKDDYNIVEEFRFPRVSQYLSKEQYVALLKRANSVSKNIKRSLDFFERTEKDTIATIESAISTLENKLQIIRQSAKFISKLKFETRLTSSSADISIIDISKGKFNNMSYSLTDRGLIINSKNTINLKN